MNKKVDDSKMFKVDVYKAVNYYNIHSTTGVKLTVLKLMKYLHPTWTDSYARSMCSWWKRGDGRYRPTLTDINLIRDKTGCPINLFVEH